MAAQTKKPVAVCKAARKPFRDAQPVAHDKYAIHRKQCPGCKRWFEGVDMPGGGKRWPMHYVEAR